MCRWFTGWPPIAIDPIDVVGFYVAVRVHLVPDDPAKPYNLANARMLCTCGVTVLEDYRTKILYSPDNATRQDSDIPR
jgi:hypothetical protein